MKRSTLSLAIGLLLACSTGITKTQHSTLEQRPEAAKMWTAKTEGRVKQLQTQRTAEIREIKAAQGNTPVSGQLTMKSEKKSATPPNLLLSGYGDLKIYSDVEFNMNVGSNHGLLAMTSADMNNDPTNEQQSLNGRILSGFDGMRKLGNGYFAGFSAQPLGDMRGSVNIDDAVFSFGRENDWKVRVGRFEACNMFPLNQDTLVERSGNTANDLYDDDSSYICMVKEGCGHSNAGGNFLISKQLDNWYFELDTLLEDGTSLYNDGNYHGHGMKQQKNVAYPRPVIAWSPMEEFTVSATMETNVVDNTYGYTDSKGNLVDQSDCTSYDMSMTWDDLKTDPENGIVVNLNTAYLDASNEEDSTAGINALWRRFELDYIYACNKIGEFNGVVCDNDCWIDDKGTYNIHTIHASYQFANAMDTEDFNIYLGTYYSILDGDGDEIYDDDSDDRCGAHVRFKYFF